MLTIGVIGAGTMGSGIAQVAIAAGETVRLYDPFPQATERGLEMIKKNLTYLISKKKLTADESSDMLARLVIVTATSDLASCDLVIEAIIEDEPLKKELFKDLETVLSTKAILATNTSSISITSLSKGMTHPERLVGMHFFNPAPRMKLIEVITGLRTSEQHIDFIIELAKQWGKVPVRATSTPGFIVNRVARPFYGEALRILAEHGTDHASLDMVMRECGGFPLGPCQLMDLIGLDVNLSVTQSVFEATAFDPRYAPSLLQQELVRAGKIGRKSGEGFYTYPTDTVNPENNETAAVKPNELDLGYVEHFLIRPLIDRLIHSGSRVTKDTASKNIPTIALTDGRTATQRSDDESTQNLVLLDLCVDFEITKRIALTHAAQCSVQALEQVVCALKNAGLHVTIIRDIAGMIVTRTIAMLANEAADLVHHRVSTPKEIDTAMTLGTGYPIGPLLWADQIGLKNISKTLKNLCDHYGPSRYRISPLMQNKSISNQLFHGPS